MSHSSRVFMIHTSLGILIDDSRDDSGDDSGDDSREDMDLKVIDL